MNEIWFDDYAIQSEYPDTNIIVILILDMKDVLYNQVPGSL